MPIEIPLETASIKASDWAFNNWQEKMSQASGAPDDSILHKIDLADIAVEYGEEAQQMIVMTFEEGIEFAENLWIENDGKNSLSNIKKVIDAIDASNSAHTLATGLGGLGVVARVSQVNGRDFIVIKGYKRHLKTLVKGHRWRANNPQMVQMGLGNLNMAKKLLKTGLVIDIIFTVSINAIDVIVNDEKTMVDFFGYSALDIIKGLAATGAGIAAAVVVSAVGAPVIAAGLAFAVIAFGVSAGLDWIDNYLGVSDQLVNQLKEVSIQ